MDTPLNTTSDVAGRLEDCRKKLGFSSRQDFCDAHKLNFGKYSQYENGSRTPYPVQRTDDDLDNIENYARIFNVSPAWLFWGIDSAVIPYPKFTVNNNSGEPLFTKGGVIYYKKNTPQIGVLCVIHTTEEQEENRQFFIGKMISFKDFIALNQEIKPFVITENEYAGIVIRYEKDF